MFKKHKKMDPIRFKWTARLNGGRRYKRLEFTVRFVRFFPRICIDEGLSSSDCKSAFGTKISLPSRGSLNHNNGIEFQAQGIDTHGIQEKKTRVDDV